MVRRKDNRFDLALSTKRILGGLLLVTSLSVGCTAITTYPRPIHGSAIGGSVISVDLRTRTLIVAPPAPATPVTIEWQPDAKFWRNGVPIRPADIEPGQSIRIHYHVDGGTERLTAHHVYLSVPWAPQH